MWFWRKPGNLGHVHFFVHLNEILSKRCDFRRFWVYLSINTHVASILRPSIISKVRHHDSITITYASRLYHELRTVGKSRRYQIRSFSSFSGVQFFLGGRDQKNGISPKPHRRFSNFIFFKFWNILSVTVPAIICIYIYIYIYIYIIKILFY